MIEAPVLAQADAPKAKKEAEPAKEAAPAASDVLPLILFAILGRSFWLLVFVSILFGWPALVGVVRAEFLRARNFEYVRAARALGVNDRTIMFRHILPQCIAPYLILATTHLGVAIIIEAALGFLGVGIPPPTPTWGNMLSDSLNAGLVPPWWLVLFPGAAITLTVLAFNLLGDGIRDLASPVDGGES